MEKINVGIVGAAGYTGGELIRLLLHHPHVNIAFALSNSQAGKKISTIHTDLQGDTDLAFSSEYHNTIQVVFLCAGHGEAKKFLTENVVADSVKVIDIGNDFRLAADAQFAGRTFVYGLPELNRASIEKASSIANPGCFATAIQLALLPLAKQQLLQNVYTTGITGSTGAGQALAPTSHFSWRANNIQAYKTLTHQHLGEIQRSLLQLNGTAVQVNFVPWRGDFTRGIFTSNTVPCTLPLSEALQLYQSYYQHHPFVTISEQPIHIKQVVNTNKCLLQLEKQGDHLVVHSAIDNLLKGAVGQAVQNMNILFQWPETTGLLLKANAF
ncbi:MAG: N-acetyl-gamma-glutamyl-phosphate reductase [Bacteroidetes bacterium]|nr:MAG: N-acetyl-gamma-glutamyl-phosphate reductase [Bacteroidota bacterium]TAF92332.1 MAG: N-acetyl-gamma-glutamyl-phosphate reductase [Bacteroidota bacterium]